MYVYINNELYVYFYFFLNGIVYIVLVLKDEKLFKYLIDEFWLDIQKIVSQYYFQNMKFIFFKEKEIF